MKENTNLLVKYLGGSHLYGTNTPESDIDYRGVFVNTDPCFVFGIKENAHSVKSTEEEDYQYFALPHFIKQCLKGNTTGYECLFNNEFIFMDDMFREHIINQKYKFIDSDAMFRSLNGYIFNETRLATGERTGLLGSKRKKALEEYGFSPKNFSHLIRLSFCGIHFFKTGIFPTNLKDYPEVFDIVYGIKTSPDSYTKDELIKISKEYHDKMIKTFDDGSEFTKIKPDFEVIGNSIKEITFKNFK